MQSRMIERAIAHAKANPVEKLPQLGAILSLDGRVIGKGWNSYKSHPLAAKFSRHEDAIYLHAELDAIINALRTGGCSVSELRFTNLHIARVLKDGTPALAKPCSGCVRAIAAFGICEVEWTKGNNYG